MNFFHKHDAVPELVSTDVEVGVLPKYEYTECVEVLVKLKAHECDMLARVHLNRHELYKRAETYYNIPIITITAMVGFASALNVRFDYMNIIIGLLSLFVSLLKSYFSYLQISQKNENHRVSYLQYSQIADEIKIELSLTKDLRQPAAYMLHLIKVKMRNLKEVSLIVPSDDFKQLKKLFQTEEMTNLKKMARQAGLQSRDLLTTSARAPKTPCTFPE